MLSADTSESEGVVARLLHVALTIALVTAPLPATNMKTCFCFVAIGVGPNVLYNFHPSFLRHASVTEAIIPARYTSGMTRAPFRTRVLRHTLSPCWLLTPAQDVDCIKPKTTPPQFRPLGKLHRHRRKPSSKSGKFLPGRRRPRLVVVASEEQVIQVVRPWHCRRWRLSRMEREPISPAEIGAVTGKPAGRQKLTTDASVTLRW